VCRFIWFIQINETDLSHQPVLVLRYNTERSETITIWINELIGTDPSKLPPSLARLVAGQWKEWVIPLKWDGKVPERIVEHPEQLLLR
jgi:UDP-N-acetylglucosamine 2-epimerase (non-hydrolysing)